MCRRFLVLSFILGPVLWSKFLADLANLLHEVNGLYLSSGWWTFALCHHGLVTCPGSTQPLKAELYYCDCVWPRSCIAGLVLVYSSPRVVRFAKQFPARTLGGVTLFVKDNLRDSFTS